MYDKSGTKQAHDLGACEYSGKEERTNRGADAYVSMHIVKL